MNTDQVVNRNPIDSVAVNETITRSTRLRDDVQGQARTIANRAMEENRALTDAEVRELTVLREDATRYESAITEANKTISDARSHQAVVDQFNAGTLDPANMEGPLARTYRQAPKSAVLKRSDSFETWARTNAPADKATDGFDLGKAVRGIASGSWDDADVERRSMSEGVLGNGGYTIPTLVSAQIVDRARNASQVMALGATTAPMTSATLRLPRLNTDPTATWRNELAAIADSTPALGAVDLTARSLACMVRVSVELLEDTPSLGEFLLATIGEAMGVELDRAALLGSGVAPEPRGLRNTAGINTVSMGTNGSTPASYANLLSAIGAVRATNFEPNGILVSGRTATTFDGLLDTTLQPLQIPPAVAAIPRVWSNQIPNTLTQGTSNDCSDGYVGAWEQLVIGIRSGISLRMLDQRYADTGEVAFVATLRGDVAVMRPSAFTVLTGIRP
jgi:HK97 family phage major capsid protein